MSGRWLFVPLAALAGCKTLGAGATESYSLLYSCPVEQIQTFERSDLDAAAVLEQWHASTGTTPTGPPPGVAEDPARRELWEARRAEVLAKLDEKTAFEVRGCGHQEFFLCAHTKNPKNGATYTNEVACIENPFRRDARPPSPE